MPVTTDPASLEQLQNHVLGGLMGAALGDALGAATEQHQIDEIIEEHGGLLRELVPPPVDTFSHSDTAGLVTDDCSQMFALAQALISAGGALDVQSWLEALLHWSQTSPMRHQMGPTTRPQLEALARGESADHIGVVGSSTRKLTSMGTTNGSAMRVAPAGLVHPGDIEAAVELAWITCQPTHDTQIAAAAAGAIAAGVAAALQYGVASLAGETAAPLTTDAVFAVAGAALEGARLGEDIGRRNGRFVAGPNVRRRIELAINEALRANSFEEALRQIEATVGNSVMAVESVPAAVGIFVAAGGDALQCAVGGTNIGNDTDTIAAMAGAMAGALQGYDALPADKMATIHDVNDEDIPALAAGLAQIARRNWQQRQEQAR